MKSKPTVKIDYNDEKHEYNVFIDNVFVGRWDSVNQVLQAVGLLDFSKVPQDKLLRAQKFGKAVHYATALDDVGRLDMSSVNPAILPHLESWRKFKKDYGLSFVESEIEQKMGSLIWRFCGTPDRYKIDGRTLLIPDLKSGSAIYDTTDLQLGGYEALIPEWLNFTPKKVVRLIVQTTDEGIPKVHECKDITDKTVFLSYLNTYRYELKHKIKREWRT